MEWRNMAPEDEGIFETTPETPELVRDFVNAGLDYQPTADSIPSGELSLFRRSLLGSDSLALQLLEEYESGLTASDTGEYFMLDLNIVPSPESTAETNAIEGEYGDDYVISDGYARFRMRIVAIPEFYITPRRKHGVRYRIVHIGVKDKQEKGYGMELFLNPDNSVDAGFSIKGKYDRRLASPQQQLIIAEMISGLLKPEPLGDNESDPDLQ